MANYIKWGAVASQSLLTTELNSLGNNTVSGLGTEYNNATGLYIFSDLVLVLASLTPTAGGFVAVYLAPALDGTNYPDATREAQAQQVGVFSLNATTGAKRTTLFGVQLPPSKFKLYVDNQSGVAFGASGNTVTGYLYGPEVQ